MKRLIAFLLVLSMGVSLLTACAQKEPGAETGAVADPAATAPTEFLELRRPQETQAPHVEVIGPGKPQNGTTPGGERQDPVSLGILTPEQLADPQRIVTVGEASAMLQTAYVHRTGVESKMLAELSTAPEYANEPATLIWLLGVPGLADMELSHGEKYENYAQWRTYLNTQTQGMEDLWWSFSWRLSMNTVVTGIAEPKTPYRFDENGDRFTSTDQFGMYWNGLFDEIPWPDSPLYAYEGPDPNPVDYGRAVYDSTNGKKYYTMRSNEDWLREMTVAEVAQCALVYYNFPNPMAYPTFVAPEEVGRFNADIITEDLLNKKTDLPAPSCENLPKQWHGTVMDDMTIFERNLHPDDRIYEYEIQKVKEAGFNFIGLNLDFSWLQDNILTDPRKDCYVGFVKREDVGKLSLERLEQLDQVVALCMKYDIHLNLRVTDMGDRNGSNYTNRNLHISNPSNAPTLAARWQAIARRYADIPNEYLSFTLFTSISDLEAQGSNLLPSVESIRQVSPDRCIIADIYGWNATIQDVKAFAQQGVALSSRIIHPEEIYWHTVYYEYDGVRSILTAKGEAAIKGFDWPYQGTIDAKALLSLGQHRITPEEVMAVAREYGVGYMLSDFGVTLSPYQIGQGDHIYPRFRYEDAPYFAMITDITETMEELGYGWCFAHWYGPYGVAFSAPVIQTSTYEQVADYPYYIDQGMMRLFQKLNGVQ